MDKSFCNGRERRKTKICAWIATIIYLLLFPFLVMFAGASTMVFDSPSMTITYGLSIIFLSLCIPLSIPITLYFVWSRYSQDKYKISRLFCLIPFCIAVVTFFCFILEDIIRFLF